MSNESLDMAINQEINRLVRKGEPFSVRDAATPAARHLRQLGQQVDMQEIADRADELLRWRFDPIARAGAMMDGSIPATPEQMQKAADELLAHADALRKSLERPRHSR